MAPRRRVKKLANRWRETSGFWLLAVGFWLKDTISKG
jgi:hypothetical protein